MRYNYVTNQAGKSRDFRDFGRSKNDSGSPEVQIVLLSKQINNLQPHFKKHTHDRSSRRGLLGMVSKRRKMLDFLKKKNLPVYQSLIKKLGLRR